MVAWEWPVLLSKNPRTLHNLWMEWECGIDGNNAAKKLTAVERVKKCKNYQRMFLDNDERNDSEQQNSTN